MAIGQSIEVGELGFGVGRNSFMQNAPGDIFVTDLGINLSSDRLTQLGVHADKQNFVISFSEEKAFEQGVRVRGSNPDRGIYTIPRNSSLKGRFIITRLRR